MRRKCTIVGICTAALVLFLALFLLPYMLAASSGAAYSRALCALACASALEELMLQLSRESCDEDAASILQRRAVRRNPGRTK